MKMMLAGFVMLAGLSAMAAPQEKLICATGNSVDQISRVEIVPADLTGRISATVIFNDLKVAKPFVTQGSLDDARVQLSYVYGGPRGNDSVYLEKTPNGYALVKYTQCNFSYQEETCSSDEPLEEVARETVVACVKL